MKKTLISLIVGFTALAGHSAANAEDLISVYQQAKMSDPSVLKAEAQYRASEDGIDLARSVLLPQINANAGISGGQSEQYVTDLDPARVVSGDFRQIDYGISLNMQVYRHDSWLSLDNAKKAAHRSDVGYQIAKQDLIIRVTQAYFDVLSAYDDLDFSGAEKKAIERQLEQTKQRYAVGLTAITDVHEAQAQYDNAITDEIRAQNGVYNAEEALRVITNVYPKELNPLNTDRFSTARPIPDNVDQWQQTAEAKNLSLIAQKNWCRYSKREHQHCTLWSLPYDRFCR